MKSRFLITALLGLIVSFSAQAQRIVGYLPSYASAATINAIEYNKMTDVIFCFINPNAAGTSLITDRVGDLNFDFEMEKFQILKSKCYPRTANGPKLWIAMGGADGGNARANRIASIVSSGAGRTNLATLLVNFAVLHELEGIDIDWEFPTAGQSGDLGLFLVELRSVINSSTTSSHLKISVAVGGETQSTCSSGHLPYFPTSTAAVNAVDYFHIMTYDLPAAYDNNHSEITDCNTSLNDWSSCKSIPKSKLLMGVPFYGKTSPRGGTLNYADINAGNFPAAYTADQVTQGSTYYYNGSTTIGAKINAVRSTHNANGIMIWDISQDKVGNASYSLLSYAHGKMFGDLATNPCSTRPFLGKDTTLCIGQTLTLDPGVSSTSAAGTRTFAWTRNGSATGGNTNTLSATQAGTYKVTITQAPTNCVVTDEIVVSEQPNVSAVTATPNTVCATTTPTAALSATTTGTLEWYTAATGGAPFAIGSTNVTPSVTTTYYAEASGVPSNKKYYTGRAAILSSSIWNDLTRDPVMTSRPEWVQVLTVLQPITLKSVVVYSANTGIANCQIMIMDASQPIANTPVYTSGTVSFGAHANEPWNAYPNLVTLNATLQPGTYNIGVYGPGLGIGVEHTLTYATGIPNICSMSGNALQNNGTTYVVSGSYGQIFDWRFEAAALSQCTRQSVVVTYNCPAPVSWLSFEGHQVENTNVLDWSTASELNNSHFIVERSENGEDFYAIGTVNGNGTSSEIHEYSYTDQAPAASTEYYRLAQIDIDGTVNYSNVLTLYTSANNSYSVAPNPFEQALELRSVNGQRHAQVSITDARGLVVFQQELLIGIEGTAVGQSLHSGLYFVSINDGQSVFTYKVVKK